MHIYAYVCELTSIKRAVRWQRLRAVRAAVGLPALSLVFFCVLVVVESVRGVSSSLLPGTPVSRGVRF